MPNIQERANSQRQANIVYKVTQATNLMKANGAMVNGFESTEKFVDELQKYLKIMKRCDADHIADCWPTKKVITSEGEEIEVSKVKTRSALGFKDSYYLNKNVAIVLDDGACLILTYNPANGGIGIGDELTSINKLLPVGNGNKEFLEYTTNTTSGLAFIMDVNGNKGPNKESVISENTTKYYDIRSFNGAYLSKFKFALIDTPTAFNCAENPTNKFCAQMNAAGQSYTGYTDDRWAGANNDCAALGGHLPTINELLTICKSNTEKAKYGISGYMAYLWSSELRPNSNGSNWALYMLFSSCATYSNNRYITSPRALCIAD